MRWSSFRLQAFCSWLSLPGRYCIISGKLGGSYEMLETRLDLSLWCRSHCQIEEVQNLFKQNEVLGSRHSPWTPGSISTCHRHYWQFKACHEYFGTQIVLELLQGFSMFCKQVSPNYSTADRIVAERLTHSLQETRQTLIIQPTNTAPERDQPYVFVPFEINWCVPESIDITIAKLPTFLYRKTDWRTRQAN